MSHTHTAASRLVLSYHPPEDSAGEWSDRTWAEAGRKLRQDSIRQYLRRAHRGPVTPGEEWSEFVSRGCASPLYLKLSVEAVENGEALGEQTEIAFVPGKRGHSDQ